MVSSSLNCCSQNRLCRQLVGVLEVGRAKLPRTKFSLTAEALACPCCQSEQRKKSLSRGRTQCFLRTSRPNGHETQKSDGKRKRDKQTRALTGSVMASRKLATMATSLLGLFLLVITPSLSFYLSSTTSFLN
jgi:hypothetical protein